LSVFSLIETDVANAYQTISALMALDIQQNGVTGARAGININGWVEALNDGILPSYDGNRYTTYGTATRNGAVGVDVKRPCRAFHDLGESALSTVDFCPEDIAQAALRLMGNRLQKAQQAFWKVGVSPKLAVRQSVAELHSTTARHLRNIE
jgi:hypothetical protein